MKEWEASGNDAFAFEGQKRVNACKSHLFIRNLLKEFWGGIFGFVTAP